MKTPLNLLFLLIFSLNSFGQKRGFLSLSRGIGVPIGKFAGSNSREDKLGYAKTGLMSDFSAGYLVYRNFGLVAMFRNQHQPFNNEAYEYNNSVKETEVIATSDPWKIRSGLAGIYFSQPIFKRFSIQPKILCGITYIKPAVIHQTYIDWDGRVFYSDITGPPTTSFSFLLGWTLTYSLSKKLNLLVSTDYMQTKAVYKQTQYRKENGYNPFSPKVNKPIHLLNFGLGLSFCF